MLNPIDEMHELSRKSYDELFHLAIDNFGFCPNGRQQYSKIEVITYIIAHTAVLDFLGKNMTTTNERKPYVLEDDNHTYHVKLTPDQADFMEWCANKEVNFRCIDIEEPLDIEWEEP